MIQSDHWHIVHPQTGAAIWHSRGRWCWQDMDVPRLFTRGEAEALLSDRPARWCDDPATIVRAPQCGCCGALDRGGTYGAPTLRQVSGGSLRCDRHLGRVPCCIDGCGRTFEATGGYDAVVICGRHWRQAPRIMRDVCRRAGRAGRRHGWPPHMIARYERLFARTVRAVTEEHRLDPSEIEALFGWAA